MEFIENLLWTNVLFLAALYVYLHSEWQSWFKQDMCPETVSREAGDWPWPVCSDIPKLMCVLSKDSVRNSWNSWWKQGRGYGFKWEGCPKLSCVPKKRYVEILTLSTSECDLI